MGRCAFSKHTNATTMEASEMKDMNLEEALNQVGLTKKRTKSGYPTSLSLRAIEVSKQAFKATKDIQRKHVQELLQAEYGRNPLYFWYVGNGEFQPERLDFENIEAVKASCL